jgi:hypothetical protein
MKSSMLIFINIIDNKVFDSGVANKIDEKLPKFSRKTCEER